MKTDLFKDMLVDPEITIMNILDLEKEYTEPIYYSLKTTTLINEDFLNLFVDFDGDWNEIEKELGSKKLKAWKFVLKLYQTDSGPFAMILASVANAILTQDIWIFVTSRRNLYELTKNDKNHLKKFELSWKQYNAALSYLFRSGLIRRIEPSVGRKAGIFALSSKDLLSILDLDYTGMKGWKIESTDYQNHKREEVKAVYKFRDQWNGK